MNGMTDVLDSDAVAEDDSVFEIWRASRLLRVDSNLRLSMIIKELQFAFTHNCLRSVHGFLTRFR